MSSSTTSGNDPGSEYAQYFDTVPAVIVCVPSWYWDIQPDDYAGLIRPLTEDPLPESTDGIEIHVRIQTYQIGSAAEWSRTMAVVIEYAGPTVSFLAGLVTVAPYVLKVMKTLRDHNNTQMAGKSGNEGDQPLNAPPPALGLPMAIGLAGLHYQATYGPLEGVSVNWFARATDHLGSIEHPSGRETYVIKVENNHENFIYHITGEGRCTEHFYLAGHRLISLDIPNW